MIVWKRGFEGLYKGVNPEKVYTELTSLGDSVTPDTIVEAAKNPSCELHKCFTWDNKVAAEKWRKQEARQLRHLLVIRDDEDKTKPELCAFHFTVSAERGPSYKPATVVFKEQGEYAALLKRCTAELKAIADRNRMLEDDLGYIFKLIDSLP